MLNSHDLWYSAQYRGSEVLLTSRGAIGNSTGIAGCDIDWAVLEVSWVLRAWAESLHHVTIAVVNLLSMIGMWCCFLSGGPLQGDLFGSTFMHPC
jgi:hypothetical protein